MVRLSSLAAAVSWLQLSSAWLPSERPEGTLNKKWLPGSGKIRGVNLGSLFVFEPWIANSAWTGLGCEDSPDRSSEFDCVSKLGQEQADAAFQGHWASFITESDLDEMKRYGINTIRIPLGYWLDRSLVDSSENFPQGAEEYLVRVCGWATARGLYIILDHHGAPGAQVAKNAFTGQLAPSPGFYNEYNYGRGVKFLQYLTKLAHERPEMENVGMIEVLNEPMENVGMIEVLNEPVHWDQFVESLRSTFYRDAYNAIRQVERDLNAIRQVERDLNVSPDDQFHIQMMGSGWGAGNPVEFLSDTQLTAFDDHRYLKWANRDEVPLSHESFISTSCSDNLSRDSAGPTIIGEWSLSVPDEDQWSDEWHPESQKDFYRKWFAAQIHSYETRAEGWVFWTWKTQLGDYRWGYKDAVAAGVIPENIDEALNSGVCG
ncbi:glucan endo-1 like protein [Verticillium longisporum]|nr:glucan endo-1 like protein [Verticillium longisporum]